MSYHYQERKPPVAIDKDASWRSYIESLPWQPGQLDEATYLAFLRACSLGIDRQTALEAVIERNRAAQGRLRRRKVQSQLERAYGYVGAGGVNAPLPTARTESPQPSAWPSRDVKLVERISSSGPGLYDLWESSPVRFEDDGAHTETIVDALFPRNPLLCVGLTDYKFWTQERELFRGSLANLQFVVSSPMSAKSGLTKDGKQSDHTLENTGPRWFLVIEFDQGAPDEQAALLDYLSQRGPLVLVVHSGGKSLHGWFYCAGTADAVLRRFMTLARRLGADLATWRNRSQFVRMPDGRRVNSNRQTVFYFNPGIL